MQTLNIHDAKTQFSKLVDAATRGEKIVIAKAGKPVAAIVGLDAVKPVRQPGLLKGQVEIADDFDAPLPDDILAGFEGR